jgi:hypothetical protein
MGSGEFDEIGIVITPKVFIAVGQDQDTLWFECKHGARVMCHENHGSLVTAQGTKNLLATCGVKVIGGLVEEQNIGT